MHDLRLALAVVDRNLVIRLHELQILQTLLVLLAITSVEIQYGLIGALFVAAAWSRILLTAPLRTAAPVARVVVVVVYTC